MIEIGLLMPCFPRNIKLPCEQFQYNLALFVLTRFNSLTEGFLRILRQSVAMATNVLKPTDLILFTEPAFFGRTQFMRCDRKFSCDRLSLLPAFGD
jgi:hypothetical protein